MRDRRPSKINPGGVILRAREDDIDIAIPEKMINIS